MGDAGDDVRRPGPDVAEQRQGVDRPLDALARTEQAPGEQTAAVGRPATVRAVDRRRGVAAPCGITATLPASTSKSCEQPVAGALGHHDDGVGRVARPPRAPPLMGRRCADHGVGDDDRTAPSSAASTSRTVVAVGAAVDAVLVLDDGDVGPVEGIALRPRRRPVLRRARRRRTGPRTSSRAAAAHDVDPGAVGHQPGGQRGRERGDATRGRREGGQDPERADAGSATSVDDGTTDARRAPDGRLGRGVEPAKGDEAAAAVQPKRGDSPKRVIPSLPLQRVACRRNVPLLSPPARSRDVAPAHRRARADRLAHPAAPLRTVGAVRLAAHRGARRRRPRRHAVRHRRLGHDRRAASHVAARVVRGRPDRAQGRRVPAHRRRVRARRRLRHHPQRLRLPAAHLQRPRRHAGGDHDPRLLVAADRARLRALRRDDHATWRSATPTATRACTTRRRSTTASTSTRSPSTRPRRPPAVLRADPPRQGDGRGHRGRARAPVGASSSPASSRTSAYFRDEVAPHVDGDRVRYVGPVGAADRAAVLGGAHALLHLIDFDEPFGYSVVEAMACGTPVIAHDRGSMAELIADGAPGSSSTTSTRPCAAVDAAGDARPRRHPDRHGGALRPGDDGRHATSTSTATCWPERPGGR